jgi:hypothetical protein
MKTLKRIFCGLAAALSLAASQPIQLTTVLTLSATGITTQQSVPGLYVAWAGSTFAQGVQAIPTTSGGTALNISNLPNVGYCTFQNLDPANYVQILTAVSGTVFARLVAGDSHLFRFDPSVTAPAMIAHTATVSIQYLCLSN